MRPFSKDPDDFRWGRGERGKQPVELITDDQPRRRPPDPLRPLGAFGMSLILVVLLVVNVAGHAVADVWQSYDVALVAAIAEGVAVALSQSLRVWRSRAA